MKLKFSDSFPLFILVLSLSMALFNPIIRESDILRVGWAIIHTIIAVGYVVGLVILKAIRNLRSARIKKVAKEQLIKAYEDLKDTDKAPPGSGVWNRARGYVDALEWVLKKIRTEYE